MNDATHSPPTLELLRAHREEILRLAAKYGARNVRVFGSVARGNASPNSDVDVLVQFPDTYRLMQHAGLTAGLRDLLERDVDVSVEANLRDEVRENVLRDAVPL